MSQKADNALAEIAALIEANNEIWSKIVSGLTDLQAAVTALTTTVTAATAAFAAGAGDSDSAVETLAQQVQAQTAALNDAMPASAAPTSTASAAVTKAL